MTTTSDPTTPDAVERQYQDSDGNTCDLVTLCRREPGWAANRIDTLLAERARHAEEVARLRDVHLDETRALDDLRLKEIASLRDQLRKAEGERDEAVAHRLNVATDGVSDPRRIGDVDCRESAALFPSEVRVRFGWYYEGGGNCCAEGDDLWQLIDEAVSEAACSSLPGQLDKVRVGEMESLSASDMIDADDVLEMVHDRLYDQVEDGTAEADDGFAAALTALLDEHISLHPSSVCHGRFPLPVEYREGEWTFGGDHNPEPDEDDEPAAVIIYTTEPSPETGHIGWCWWALGKMGEAPSLRGAMTAAEEVIRRRNG